MKWPFKSRHTIHFRDRSIGDAALYFLFICGEYDIAELKFLCKLCKEIWCFLSWKTTLSILIISGNIPDSVKLFIATSRSIPWSCLRALYPEGWCLKIKVVEYFPWKVYCDFSHLSAWMLSESIRWALFLVQMVSVLRAWCWN